MTLPTAHDLDSPRLTGTDILKQFRAALEEELRAVEVFTRTAAEGAERRGRFDERDALWRVVAFISGRWWRLSVGAERSGTMWTGWLMAPVLEMLRSPRCGGLYAQHPVSGPHGICWRTCTMRSTPEIARHERARDRPPSGDPPMSLDGTKLCDFCGQNVHTVGHKPTCISLAESSWLIERTDGCATPLWWIRGHDYTERAIKATRFWTREEAQAEIDDHAGCVLGKPTEHVFCDLTREEISPHER